MKKIGLNSLKVLVFVVVLAWFINPGFELALSEPDKPGESQRITRYVKIDNKTIGVDFDNDGIYEPYFIKGVMYNPVPVGYNLKTTYNFLDDAMVLERDFIELKNMNANTIYLAYANGVEIEGVKSQLKMTDKTLAFAQEYGLKVIAGFYVPKTKLLTLQGRNQVLREFADFIRRYKNSNCILFWALSTDGFAKSNEAEEVKSWVRFANYLAYLARCIEGSGYHPTAVILKDKKYIIEKETFATNIPLPYIEIWGLSLDNLYEFASLLNQLKTSSAKPIWFSEIGVDAWRINYPDYRYPNTDDGYEDQDSQAEAVGALWDEIIKNTDITLGATFKEYSDEWWRAEKDSPWQHRSFGSRNNSFFDRYQNDAWFGIMGVVQAAGADGVDTLYRRKVFDCLKDRFKNPIEFRLPKIEFISLSISNNPTYSQECELRFTVKNIGGRTSSPVIARLNVHIWRKSGETFARRTYSYSVFIPSLVPLQEWSYSSLGKLRIPTAGETGIEQVVAYIESTSLILGRLWKEGGASATRGLPYKLHFVSADRGSNDSGDGTFERPWRDTIYPMAKNLVSSGEEIKVELDGTAIPEINLKIVPSYPEDTQDKSNEPVDTSGTFLYEFSYSGWPLEKKNELLWSVGGVIWEEPEEQKITQDWIFNDLNSRSGYPYDYYKIENVFIKSDLPLEDYLKSYFERYPGFIRIGYDIYSFLNKELHIEFGKKPVVSSGYWKSLRSINPKVISTDPPEKIWIRVYIGREFIGFDVTIPLK